MKDTKLRLKDIRKSNFIYAAFALLFLINIGCNPAKKYTQTGDKLAAAGNYEDATGYYYTALLKKPGYAPAQSGLKINAQKVLNDKFEIFRKQVQDNQIEPAIKQYQNNQKFFDNAEKTGVHLEWKHEFDEVYTEIKHEYARTLFDDVIHLINQKKFDQAERQLHELALLDTAYSSVSVLRMNTVLLPLYKEGVTHYQQGNFKEAYATFSKVAEIDDQFEEVITYREKSLTKATIRYGIFPVHSEDQMVMENLDELLDRQLNKRKSTFTEVNGYRKVQSMLESRGWNRIKSPQDAIQAAKNLGLQNIIFIEVKTLLDQVQPRIAEKKSAYESFTENIPNPYTDTYTYITKFKKVEYTDVSEGQRIKYNVSIQILDVATGLPIFSDNFDMNRVDELHKLECKCNINNLYQDLPEGNYLPPSNKEWREQFTVGKAALMPKNTFKLSILTEMASQISAKLKNKY